MPTCHYRRDGWMIVLLKIEQPYNYSTPTNRIRVAQDRSWIDVAEVMSYNSLLPLPTTKVFVFILTRLWQNHTIKIRQSYVFTWTARLFSDKKAKQGEVESPNASTSSSFYCLLPHPDFNPFPIWCVAKAESQKGGRAAHDCCCCTSSNHNGQAKPKSTNSAAKLPRKVLFAKSVSTKSCPSSFPSHHLYADGYLTFPSGLSIPDPSESDLCCHDPCPTYRAKCSNSDCPRACWDQSR